MAKAFVLLLLTALLHLAVVHSHLITPAPRLPTYEHDNGEPLGEELFGQQPNAWLGKRGVTDCDGAGIFTCPVGTCYAGDDGWIGCCSVSSCAARKTCLDYNPRFTPPCDVNTGGCLICTDSSNPYCATIFNGLSDKFIFYCTTKSTSIWTWYHVPITQVPSLSTDRGYLRTWSASTVSVGTAIASSTTTETVADASGSVSSVVVAATSTSGGDPSPASSASTTIDSADPSTHSHTPVQTKKSSGSDDTKISQHAIVGIAVGAATAIGVIVVVVWLCIRRHRKQRKDSYDPAPPLWQGTTSGPYSETFEQPKIVEVEDTSPQATQEEWHNTPELDSIAVSPATTQGRFTPTSPQKQHPHSLTPGVPVSPPTPMSSFYAGPASPASAKTQGGLSGTTQALSRESSAHTAGYYPSPEYVARDGFKESDFGKSDGNDGTKG